MLPATESLKDTLARVLPFWNDRIVAELKAGKNVLVVAHGNSLRAVVKMLDNVSEADITELNIPTGVPLVYELDDDAQAGEERLPRRPGSHQGRGRSREETDREEALTHAIGDGFRLGHLLRAPAVVASALRGRGFREPAAEILHVGHGQLHRLVCVQALAQLAAFGLIDHVGVESLAA